MNILVTGANRGIGFGLVQRFVEMGCNVIAGMRRPSEAFDLAALAKLTESSLKVLPLDVDDPQSVERMGCILNEANEPIDILINNAAVYLDREDESFWALDLGKFEATIRTNLVGPAMLTQQVLPLLLKDGDSKVINVSSGVGLISPKSDFQHYCYGTSKAALNMLTRTLAAEFGPKGVTVVAMSPGWVRTDMGGPNAHLSVEEATQVFSESILNLSASKNGLFLEYDGTVGKDGW